jgi:hypothetical protein
MRSAWGNDVAPPRQLITSASGSELLHRVPQAEECSLPCSRQVTPDQDIYTVDYTQAICRER